MTRGHTAAFFRLEGILVSRGAISAAGYFAANSQGLAERALKLSQVALAAPVYSFLGQSDRVLANRLAYVALRHASEDRIVELADEYVQGILRGEILEGGVELMRKARREGHRIVVISDMVSHVIEPLLPYLRYVDDHIENQLELKDGYATGKLREPVIGGHDSARWAKRYAQQHGLDMSRSVVYGAHGPDLLLLSTVGLPCAVNPDFTLRRAARQSDWPIIDYDV